MGQKTGSEAKEEMWEGEGKGQGGRCEVCWDGETARTNSDSCVPGMSG